MSEKVRRERRNMIEKIEDIDEFEMILSVKH